MPTPIPDPKTNKDFAATLRGLASLYEHSEAVPRTPLNIYVFDKEHLVSALKEFGGQFQKTLGYGGDSMIFSSVLHPGLSIYIPRDKVCKKTVTYDCTPVLTPEEEKAINVDWVKGDLSGL